MHDPWNLPQRRRLDYCENTDKVSSFCIACASYNTWAADLDSHLTHQSGADATFETNEHAPQATLFPRGAVGGNWALFSVHLDITDTSSIARQVCDDNPPPPPHLYPRRAGTDGNFIY